jgi:signal transduction histidine kinase
MLTAAFLLAANVMAEDRFSIEKNVQELATAIATGKDATGFAADSYTPYVFVMEAAGKLLVHPTLAGENLQDKALAIYQALSQATPEGVWVTYNWKGKEKHTFAKRLGANLIIASGY